MNISGYYQQYRGGSQYSAGQTAQNAFAKQLERDKLMSMNKLTNNYNAKNSHSSALGGKDEEADQISGNYRPQSNLSGSMQHYDQQRGQQQQSRQGLSFGSDERTKGIGQGIRHEAGGGGQQISGFDPQQMRMESKESANWGGSP